jgi:hypothetical protein
MGTTTTKMKNTSSVDIDFIDSVMKSKHLSELVSPLVTGNIVSVMTPTTEFAFGHVWTILVTFGTLNVWVMAKHPKRYRFEKQEEQKKGEEEEDNDNDDNDDDGSEEGGDYLEKDSTGDREWEEFQKYDGTKVFDVQCDEGQQHESSKFEISRLLQELTRQPHTSRLCPEKLCRKWADHTGVLDVDDFKTVCEYLRIHTIRVTSFGMKSKLVGESQRVINNATSFFEKVNKLSLCFECDIGVNYDYTDCVRLYKLKEMDNKSMKIDFYPLFGLEYGTFRYKVPEMTTRRIKMQKKTRADFTFQTSLGTQVYVDQISLYSPFTHLLKHHYSNSDLRSKPQNRPSLIRKIKKMAKFVENIKSNDFIQTCGHTRIEITFKCYDKSHGEQISHEEFVNYSLNIKDSIMNEFVGDQSDLSLKQIKERMELMSAKLLSDSCLADDVQRLKHLYLHETIMNYVGFMVSRRNFKYDGGKGLDSHISIPTDSMVISEKLLNDIIENCDIRQFNYIKSKKVTFGCFRINAKGKLGKEYPNLYDKVLEVARDGGYTWRDIYPSKRKEEDQKFEFHDRDEGDEEPRQKKPRTRAVTRGETITTEVLGLKKNQESKKKKSD